MNAHRRSPGHPRRRAWLAGLAGLAACGPATWASPAAAGTGDACLRAELSARPDFVGVALMRQRGQTRLAAQGAADDTGRPLDDQDRFNIGSVSKMFTAVAVAQLVERGRLALDGPIGRWVDPLDAEVAAVTLRQLLTHSAGLGNFYTPDNLTAMQAAGRLADLLPLARDTRPRFTPGTRFQYSNNGFLLLGLAVERASGMSFDAYLREQVFTPAGMAATSLRPEGPRLAAQGFTRLPPIGVGPPPRMAASPGSSGGPPPMPTGPLRAADEARLPGTSAGGAYSTAGDLMRFFDALQAGRLVGVATLRELTRPQIESLPGQHYGLGFGLVRWEGHEGYGHNGGAPGVNAEAMVFPADDLVLIVLSNRDPPGAGQQMQALRRAALKDKLCSGS
ncbi:MAG: serine hydrolase domain-containing protein [Aquabacterium sp.]